MKYLLESVRFCFLKKQTTAKDTIHKFTAIRCYVRVGSKRIFNVVVKTLLATVYSAALLKCALPFLQSCIATMYTTILFAMLTAANGQEFTVKNELLKPTQ